jgi:hypothetical protein
MKFSLPVILFFSYSLMTHAQLAPSRQQLVQAQDSLQSLGFKIVNNQSEPERYNANYTFIKTLVNALKNPGSFNFPFDSLKSISIQPSGDGAFRVFSWHVLNEDGSYRYYGTIQMNRPDGKLQMFPLVDYTSSIKTPADTVTTNDKWYGAQYYKIIPVTKNVRVPYYILLGWKGNTPKTTKKVIEVLSFKDGKAYFGMPVFDGDKDQTGKQRIIFEYSRQASMLLNYQQKEATIVFDHLSPQRPELKNKFEYYGPDFSYDGFKFINGRWRLTPDLALKNSPSELDQQFNDPKNPTGKPRKL